MTPRYSYWPIVLAIAVVLIAIGVVSLIGISALGLLLVFVAIIGWTWENRAEAQRGEHE
ncbi:MAG TPA: cytochrome c oxidase subunit 4 [Anaerolineaceae bacterium]|nr:cytochrome c oxidase subunit 4 [Anaerolineaceae bacterium]